MELTIRSRKKEVGFFRDLQVVRRERGVNLIELLLALAVSAVLIAGIYRVFVQQQKSYVVQEQIADMQQNVRVAVNRMLREIRMAGYGGKNENVGGLNDIVKTFGDVNGYTSIVTPEHDVVQDGILHDRITIIAAYDLIGRLKVDANAGANAITIAYTEDSPFTTKNPKKRYLCLNGRNNYEIDVEKVSGGSVPLKTGTTLLEDHRAGEPVFLVKAITYGLKRSSGIPVLYRNENTGGGGQPVAEHIESLRFHYRLADGLQISLPADPRQIRGVRVDITARTGREDPDLAKVGDGYRRRTVTTFIHLRNLTDDSGG